MTMYQLYKKVYKYSDGTQAITNTLTFRYPCLEIYDEFILINIIKIFYIYINYILIFDCKILVEKNMQFYQKLNKINILDF